MQSNPSETGATNTLSSISSLKIGSFTYDGWQEDYQAIVQSQTDDEFFGCELKFGRNPMTRDRFLGMINRQRLVLGDRSHSQIVLLDSLSLSYPGYQKDVEHAERLHIRFPSLFHDQIPHILRKQRIFEYHGNDKLDSKTNQEKKSIQSYPMLATLPTASTDSAETSSCSSRKDNTLCTICLTSQRDYAFVPCGHLCICKDCAIGVANLDGRCPICRCAATHVMRIFK